MNQIQNGKTEGVPLRYVIAAALVPVLLYVGEAFEHTSWVAFSWPQACREAYVPVTLMVWFVFYMKLKFKNRSISIKGNWL